jgi:hypothetical protein
MVVSKLPPKALKVRDWRSLSLPRVSLLLFVFIYTTFEKAANVFVAFCA